ncbi:right-handed parallel beta-helix repeat-containing protein [Ornithinimicrobium tianjinense]|uniref:Right handed beta helix domain-containing protein n=1 Tax=Ornithinimicrobium tianjinense TaxID=1195761 RepID=A0A917F2K6_9MICO|nr:right-handed parallel beta-helix repeat-containing protein [Ornithinimicrobium tianjinense]GGF44473.1 hypothetical protein GCM10011366_10260 [Ornithinimicrobium tianjinense]
MPVSLRVRPLAAAAGGAALLLSGLALPAQADALSCGDVVMSSTVLTTDLTCASGHGLVIGADGVVLDLGGHSITGPGAYGAGAGAGVWIHQRTGVTVMNGEIAHFATAVEVQQSSTVLVSEVRAHHNDRGINLGTGGGHVLEKNVITDNGRDAVRIAGSADVRVSKNVVERNVFGIGVANGAVRTIVEKNVVSGSGPWGVALFEDANDTVLDKNVVTSSRGDGIQVQWQTQRTMLTKNETSGNGDDGIDVDSTSATLIKNLAVGNGDLGIEAIDGVTDGGANMAAGNGNPLQCTGVVCIAPM